MGGTWPGFQDILNLVHFLGIMSLQDQVMYHVEVVEVGNKPPHGGAYCASTHSHMMDKQKSLAQATHVALSVDDIQ